MKILARVLAVSALSSISISAFAEPNTNNSVPVAAFSETVETNTYTSVLPVVANDPILSKLDLSAQQQAQVAKISQQFGIQRPLLDNEQKQTLANLRYSRDNLVLDRNFDDDKARKIIAQEQKFWKKQKNNMADFELTNLKREHAIYQILSPSQQQQFLRLRQQLNDMRRK